MHVLSSVLVRSWEIMPEDANDCFRHEHINKKVEKLVFRGRSDSVNLCESLLF